MTNGGMKKMSNKLPLMYQNYYDNKTLAEHAEEWWKEQGKKVPRRKTKEWKKLYEKWHAFAFQDFR